MFLGFGFYGYPYPYYYPPPAYYYPPAVVYNAPPVVYAPPQPAAQPAIQREIVYPHGKYVLEGDGVNTAYRWVWIANAEYHPSEAPKSDAPAAPPGPPPSR